jgi:hypothetical protein
MGCWYWCSSEIFSSSVRRPSRSSMRADIGSDGLRNGYELQSSAAAPGGLASWVTLPTSVAVAATASNRRKAELRTDRGRSIAPPRAASSKRFNCATAANPARYGGLRKRLAFARDRVNG